MRYLKLLIICLSLFCVGTLAYSEEVPWKFKPGSEPDGFRGIKLGTELSGLQGMKHKRTDTSHGGIEFYSTDEDSLTLGKAKLKTIEYGFWKERLYVVMIITEGVANWSALKKSVFDRFGEGARAFPHREEFLWEGERVVMALRLYEGSKLGIFYMRSLAIYDEIREEERRKAKEEGKKLQR